MGERRVLSICRFGKPLPHGVARRELIHGSPWRSRRRPPPWSRHEARRDFSLLHSLVCPCSMATRGDWPWPPTANTVIAPLYRETVDSSIEFDYEAGDLPVCQVMLPIPSSTTGFINEVLVVVPPNSSVSCFLQQGLRGKMSSSSCYCIRYRNTGVLHRC